MTFSASALRQFLTGVVLLAVLLDAGCQKKEEEAKGTDTQVQAAAKPPAWSEEAWIVSTVSGEILRMALYAAHPGVASSGSSEAKTVVYSLPAKDKAIPEYEVDVYIGGPNPILSEHIALTGNPWSPAVYGDLASKLIITCGVNPAPAVESQGNTIADLTAFTAESQLAENKSISKFLSQYPADPAAHEHAAVLLGAFAMRENAGRLWDPKLACARATAHLALANALRGSPSATDEAALAELMIGLIIDTKADCTIRIQDLSQRAAKNPDLTPWVRAAALRNTRDWRLPPLQGEGTLVEKVEKFRALGDGATSDIAVDYLKKFDPPKVTDWSRIVFSVGSSVENGHVFTNGYIESEIAEAALCLNRPVPSSEIEWQSFVKTLNDPPKSSVTVDDQGASRIEVIDQGMWCLAAQRHICHAVFATWHFMNDQWGVPNDAREFWVKAESSLSDMSLFPLIVVMKADSSEEVSPYASRLETLMKDSPQDVPDVVWEKAVRRPFYQAIPDVREMERKWFSPPLPSGTAYRFAARLNALPGFAGNLEVMEPLYRIAPLQAAVAQSYYHARYGDRKDPQAFLNIIGPMADYEIALINDLANLAEDSPEIEERALVRAAGIDADGYRDLGFFYVRQGNAQKAEEAFRAMYDKANDRVEVANSCGWLVDRYYEEGKVDDAVKVAGDAAEVYSFGGLEVYASLMERMGNLPAAEENYKNISERYNDDTLLAGFYLRQSVLDPHSPFAGKGEYLILKYFPKGLQTVSLKDFTSKPDAGVIIDEDSRLLRQNGLQPGDVIVALDGRRVNSFEQYKLVRSLKKDPGLDLIIYRDGKFQEISASAPNRRFEVKMDSWNG